MGYAFIRISCRQVNYKWDTVCDCFGEHHLYYSLVKVGSYSSCYRDCGLTSQLVATEVVSQEFFCYMWSDLCSFVSSVLVDNSLVLHLLLKTLLSFPPGLYTCIHLFDMSGFHICVSLCWNLSCIPLVSLSTSAWVVW